MCVSRLRQTELTEKFPSHVVCAWLGNSRAVAQDHYLQVTDAHFAQAVTEPAKRPTAGAESGAVSGGNDRERSGCARKAKTKIARIYRAILRLADACMIVQVTPTGFEPVSRP